MVRFAFTVNFVGLIREVSQNKFTTLRRLVLGEPLPFREDVLRKNTLEFLYFTATTCDLLFSELSLALIFSIYPKEPMGGGTVTTFVSDLCFPMCFHLK